MSLNCYQRFHETARRQPDSPAIFGPRPDAVLSYRALDESIQSIARELRAAGVGPGTCVGLHYPSSTDYIIYTYAIWHCGACVVPVSVELTAYEKAEVCRCIAIDYVLTSARGGGRLAGFAAGETTRLKTGAVLISSHEKREHPTGFDPSNCAFIRFTSGTTGSSKGVVLSHDTIDARIRAANDVLDIGCRDRVLWVLSMSYHFTVSIVSYLTFGAAIVLPENHFAVAIGTAIERTNSTVLYASPTHYALLADSPHPSSLASLRLAVSTTSSLDQRTAQIFAERFGRPIGQALGVIEVGLPCIHTSPSIDRWDSVGRAIPACSLQLEDVGLGDKSREILLKGPGMLDAYYEPFQPRNEIMRDGWFRTGDIGWRDEGEYLFLRGRSKNVINVMGMKFFPEEVERVLASHPDVKAVLVRRGPTTRRGEQVLAQVVAKDRSASTELANRLRDYCKERLASYKVPEQIEFVDALPKTASGKILHRSSYRPNLLTA
jgi:long-chain acyl-CoA synthetase